MLGRDDARLWMLTTKICAAIPKTDVACERALENYRHYESQMDTTFKELAEERSANPEVQSRIARDLWKLLQAYGCHSVSDI